MPFTSELPASAGRAAPQSASDPAAIARRFSDAEIEGLYALGLALLQAGRPERARPMMVLCGLYRPRHVKYLLGLGICCRRMGDPEQALQAFATAALRDPACFDACLQAAECLLQLGRLDEAFGFLDALIDCGPHVPAARPYALRARILRDLKGEPH